MCEISGVMTNRVALVTGASRGLGRAIALKLASVGVRVALNYMNNVDKANSVLKEIEANDGRAMIVQGDVSRESDVLENVKSILDKWNRIDILVNNAGITRDKLLIKMSGKDFEDVLATNLRGTFNCTKAVIRHMLKQHYGRIVNMTSVVALKGNISQANYSAAKAGIIGFTKSVARELATRGITVNAIAPGLIDTEMTSMLPKEIKAKMLENIPAGRMGTPEDVATAVLFLISEQANYITGQVLQVDGGMVM